MNNTQQKVWDYLTSGNGTTASRMSVLKELSEASFFGNWHHESATISWLETFISKNSGRHCPAGIQRFRDAVLPQPKKKVDTVVFTITVDAERGPGLHFGMTSQVGTVKRHQDLLLKALGVDVPQVGAVVTSPHSSEVTRVITEVKVEAEVTKSAG